MFGIELKLKIFTEDGTAGDIGRVTDAIPELIVEHDARVIYSCGPMPMLEALSQIAVQSDIAHQCAVEESMACGIGICFSCVAQVRQEGPMEWDYKRTCVEGPIFDSHQICW